MIMADTVITALLIAIVNILFVRGLLAGSVKG